MRSHVAAVPDTVREMQDAEPIRGIPVLLLTPGKSSPLSDDCLQKIGDTVTQVIALPVRIGFIWTSRNW